MAGVSRLCGGFMDEEVLEVETLQGKLRGALELSVQQAKIVFDDLVFAHGAVVFKGNRVFGVGHNEERPLTALTKEVKRYRSLSDNSAHAEMMAIKDAGWFSAGSSLLVVRWTRSNVLGNSRPCNMCMPKLLCHPCITRIYYSVNGSQLHLIRVKK